MWALAALFDNSIEIEVMGFWLQIVAVILVLFCKWGVEAQEIFNGNETNVSFMEFLSYLESIYGIADASPPPNAAMVDLTLIQGAAAKGAACLDGSLPGYHLDRGFGSGATSWLVSLQDGGWCNSVRTCNFSKTTRRGSSNFFEKQIPFTGILSNKASENPDFYNWNRVKIRYCDGASFSGEGEDKANGLQFRGQRIWQAAIDELMIKGMRNANHVLLAGCSAGGLAVILHCDQFRGFFPETTIVKCFSDAGLFMDAQDVSGGHTLRNFYAGVVSFQGVQRPISCKNNLDLTSCFFPQNLISNIKTPLFILNAAYDAWQIRASLTSPAADPNGNWSHCRKNIANCSDSQIQFLQGFRAQILNEVKGFAGSMQNGIFLNSCFAHCQSEQQVMWFGNDSPKIDNKTIAQSVGDWYFDRASVKSIDCPYPCDKTCRNIVFR